MNELINYSDKSYEIRLFDLILLKQNFLTKDECEYLIREYNLDCKYETEQSSNRYGINTASTFSVIRINPLSEPGIFLRKKLALAVDLYCEHLKQFDSFADHNLYNYAFRYAHALRILRYGVGEKINQHVDHTIGTYGSCTINLNNEYEGGEFTFLNGRKKIKLETGQLMLFPADFFWVHETMPVTSGERFSFNVFLSSIPKSERDNVFNNLRNKPFVEPTESYETDVLIPLNRKLNVHEVY